MMIDGMILTKIFDFMNTYKYQDWVYANTEEWDWELTEYRTSGHYVSGVWLNEEDTVAFRLKFGL